MRRVSILIGICMLAALVLTVAAQQRSIEPIMKEVGPTNNTLRMDIQAKDSAKTAADADKLSSLFKEANAFFKTKSMDDAVGWTNDAASAASDVSKAAKANNFDDAAKASKALAGVCKSCHDVHREQLPDKTFKLKP